MLPLHWTSCEIQAALKQSPHSEARQLLQKYFGLGVLATLASFTRTRVTETESGVCSEDERRCSLRAATWGPGSEAACSDINAENCSTAQLQVSEAARGRTRCLGWELLLFETFDLKCWGRSHLRSCLKFSSEYFEFKQVFIVI